MGLSQILENDILHCGFFDSILRRTEPPNSIQKTVLSAKLLVRSGMTLSNNRYIYIYMVHHHTAVINYHRTPLGGHGWGGSEW